MAAPSGVNPAQAPLNGKKWAAGTARNELVTVIIRYAAIGLLALTILRLWILPLGSSLCLDETGTFWLIKDGPRVMLSRMWDWPSTSAAYGYVAWAAYAVGGAREWVLRLPSVLAVALAAVFVYQIARRLLDVESAFPAVAVFVSSEYVAVSAGEARPYGLLLLVVAASTLALVRWLGTNRLRHGILYVLTAAFVVAIHMMAAPILLAHAAYAVVEVYEGGRVRLRHLLLAAVGIALLLAPLAPSFLHIFRMRGTLSYADKPGLPLLASAWVPPALLCGVISGLILAVVMLRRLSFGSSKIGKSAMVLLAALAVGVPFLFFVVSLESSTEVFLPRYMVGSQVGLALLAGWFIGRVRPVTAGWMVIGAIAICSIVGFGPLRHPWTNHEKEDWRGAMATVREYADGNTQLPIIVRSGFIESSTRRGASGYATEAYLLAPLLFYPPTGQAIMIPRNFDDSARWYADHSIAPQLERSNHFLLVSPTWPVNENLGWATWIAGRFHNFSSHSIFKGGPGEAVQVVLFDREGDRPPDGLK